MIITSSVATWKDCGSSSNYPLCVMDLYHSKSRASSLKMEPFTVSYDQRSEFLKLSYLHSFQHSNVKVRHSLNPRITPTRLHEPHTLVISNEHPQNADFPRNYSRKEKKPFPIPIVELRRAARERLKKSKGQPKGQVPPPKKGLIVQSLLPLAYDVFNARITLINNLRKLLKVVPVHACGWCDEIHVGLEGHPFKSCKGKRATLRNGLHQWTNAAIEDVLVPVEAYHLYDRLGKRITHEERFSILQIPAVMELCIQAGVHIPEYPTKRRRKPIIRIGKREFADADESDLPEPPLEVPLKPLLTEISISEAVAPANEEEKTLLAEETLQAWEKMRKGAKRLMQMYRVRACGYCPEVHVGPSGHKAQNCGAHKHQQRNGQHGWQSAVLDDLIPPRYVWHVPDVVGLPLRRELRNFYGQAPAVVEICFQAGAAVPDQYKSTMRLDIGIPSSVKEAEMAV
ncbi:hypothetical protein H0E87_029364 [Populus deltoides]|uniref:APO domain-containing protein n=1 Tax=Populus deltoides TaxID=3696 RepID=A0A8T2WN65_POPDE|nr:hypothetical protein H0E87_029364 [Populus deltoides]KAH8481853.1 hypothetical protein H0E87_029364 [Populus deltoides]